MCATPLAHGNTTAPKLTAGVSMNYNTQDRIILAPERRQYVPYSDMQIWRMEKSGTFPKRIKLGPHRVGWSLHEVTEWIDARKARRDL